MGLIPVNQMAVIVRDRFTIRASGTVLFPPVASAIGCLVQTESPITGRRLAINRLEEVAIPAASASRVSLVCLSVFPTDKVFLYHYRRKGDTKEL